MRWLTLLLHKGRIASVSVRPVSATSLSHDERSGNCRMKKDAEGKMSEQNLGETGHRSERLKSRYQSNGSTERGSSNSSSMRGPADQVHRHVEPNITPTPLFMLLLSAPTSVLCSDGRDPRQQPNSDDHIICPAFRERKAAAAAAACSVSSVPTYFSRLPSRNEQLRHKSMDIFAALEIIYTRTKV